MDGATRTEGVRSLAKLFTIGRRESRNRDCATGRQSRAKVRCAARTFRAALRLRRLEGAALIEIEEQPERRRDK